MNRLALGEKEPLPINFNCLFRQADQVHLDPVLGPIVKGVVVALRDVEIASTIAI